MITAADVEKGAVDRPRRSFGSPSLFDWNRVCNAAVVWSLILFWLWMVTYWIFLDVPFPPAGAGSKSNTFAFTDRVVTPISNALCPADIRGKPTGYCVWYYPAFAAFTIAALLVRKNKKLFRPKKKSGAASSLLSRISGSYSNDVNFLLFCYVGVGIPLIIYWSFYMYKKMPIRKPDETTSVYMSDVFESFANRIGYVAFFCMAFFLVPVTRHGPVLAVLGWHPYHAITVHMWLGWAAIACSYLHMLGYVLKYSLGDFHPTPPDENDGSSFYGYQWFLPPAMCFNPYDHNNSTSLNEAYGGDDSNTEKPPGYDNCDHMLRGFFGTIAISFLSVLAVCSTKFIRRNAYNVFYFAHIICAPMFLLFVIIHFEKNIIYIWPSLFYYFATQAPFLMQHWRWTVYNYGLKITDVMDIPCQRSISVQDSPPPTRMSRITELFSPKPIDWVDEKFNRRGPLAKPVEHCVSLDFEVSPEGYEQFYPGMYGNFWCPDASMKSHPFSIVHVPGRNDRLRVIFRVMGKWTDLVARSFLRLPSSKGHHQELLPVPKMMMDGWHGPPTLVGNALNHEKVVLVAAGIGITAFLSMATEMVELLCFNENGMFIKMDEIDGVPATKRIELHWTCRDENLIKYVTDEYFIPLMERASRKERNGELHYQNECNDEEETDQSCYNGASCHIHIHRTGDAGAKTVDRNSLWKSFCDKTERGRRSVVESSVAVHYGSPWIPYRFSFGRYSSFREQIPSIATFLAIFWTSYAVSWKITYLLDAWWYSDMYALPDAVHFVFGGWTFVPILFFSFAFAFLGHVVMDWKSNIDAKTKTAKVNCAEALESPEPAVGSTDESCMMEEIQQGKDMAPSIDVIQTSVLTMDSTVGRPSFEEMLLSGEVPEENEHENGGDSDGTASAHTVSTGVFLCGPESMVKSCKTIAGSGCGDAGKSIQNAVIFYEEKFAW